MDFKKSGYSQEEEYFYQQNKQLIDEKRQELDLRREEFRKKRSKEIHWMKCPQCGQDMVEENKLGIKLERCSSCHGVFLDNGELELLVSAKEHRGFFSLIKRTFSFK